MCFLSSYHKKGFLLTLLIVFCTTLFAKNVIIQRDSLYTLSTGDLLFTVDTKNGGKIVSFQREGKEILLQKNVHPVYYGATLWISPQKYNWPPSEVLDKRTYSVQILKDTLQLTSEKDIRSGFQFIKKFYLMPCKSIGINYIIKNISNEIKKAAAWEVTRVAPEGEFYFPIDEIIENSLGSVVIKNNTFTYTHIIDTMAPKQKLYATVKKGKITLKTIDLLFIKEFPVTKKEDLPPLQGTVEIFIAPKSKYIEMENHGKYTELKPGEVLQYHQKWSLKVLKSSKKL